MEDIPQIALETTTPGASPQGETSSEEDDAVLRSARRPGEAGKEGAKISKGRRAPGRGALPAQGGSVSGDGGSEGGGGRKGGNGCEGAEGEGEIATEGTVHERPTRKSRRSSNDAERLGSGRGDRPGTKVAEA